MLNSTFWLLLISLFSLGYSANITYFPEILDKFRTDESRVLTITIRETEEAELYDGARSLQVRCGDDFLCKIEDAPSEIALTKDNQYQTTFNITIKGTFLGVTQLQVKMNAESLQPYDLRILRSNSGHKLQLAFTIFISIFVVVISLMMGTQLESERITNIVKAPIGPVIGFLCQFGLMPTIGYLLAEYCLPHDNISIKLALFAVSTCPGGGKSSFWTIIFGGNLDLSISMTFTQTIAALIMMPIWMSTLGHQFTDKNITIPFARIVQGLIGIMIPTIAGMIFRYYKPHLTEIIHKWIKRCSWMAMIVISFFAIYTNWYMIYLLTWPIVLCGCALPWLGYITAFSFAAIFRQSFKDCVTIAIETGIQNIGIAMLLMMWCLPEPESDISVTIIFVVAIMTDKPLMVIWLIGKLISKIRRKDKIINVESGIKALSTDLEDKKKTETEVEA
ncbi:unnamed protein product [Auanema sp. JU1783]|nr:unnamed protein product [Auanema sp. JU1783]